MRREGVGGGREEEGGGRWRDEGGGIRLVGGGREGGEYMGRRWVEVGGRRKDEEVLHFSLSGSLKGAVQGYTFNSVSDLVSSDPIRTPRVVQHLVSSRTRNIDLLVVKKARPRTLARKAFIKVFSFNAKKEMILFVSMWV